MAKLTVEKVFHGKQSTNAPRLLVVDGTVDVYFQIGSDWTTNPVTYETGSYEILSPKETIKVSQLLAQAMRSDNELYSIIN